MQKHGSHFFRSLHKCLLVALQAYGFGLQVLQTLLWRRVIQGYQCPVRQWFQRALQSPNVLQKQAMLNLP